MRRGPALRSDAMDELLDLLARLEILALEAARPSLPLAEPARVVAQRPPLHRSVRRR